MIGTFIIAATTQDGYIARNETELSLDWTSEEDRKRFIALTKRAQVVVMGSKTFKTMPKPLKNRLNIVYSASQKFDQSNDPERIVETTNKEPAELIRDLEARGFSEVAICGGSQIYTKFMEAGVVDRAYITVEPVKLGSGIKLFAKTEFMEQLQNQWTVVSKETLPSGTVFIEYKK